MLLSLQPVMSKVVHVKKKINEKSQQTALKLMPVIDFFYPPFKKIMPLQTFRYAACGGGNQLLNLIIYFISYNYIFKKEVWHLGFIAFKPHIAAFIVSFIITFPIGFLLSRYIVFQGSEVRARHQAFRYFSIVGICLLLNYLLLKLFVEIFHWYPTPSMLLTIIIVVMFSFFTQKKFAFKSGSGLS